ncbi:MAG: filamentous hemagglutinin N-terminal domain-containing protein [Gammaproteobacteria bacterium]
MTFFAPAHCHPNNNISGQRDSHSSPESTPTDRHKRQILFYLLLLLTVTGLAPSAWALPTGGQVVDGQAEIVYSERTVTITQHTAHLHIEWEHFDISTDESVTLIQPEPDATAWLGVVAHGSGDGGSSTIDGTLSANGQVLISAANGLALGPASVVTAQSLLLTSLDSHPGCFVNVQHLELNRPGNPTAMISNAGTITTVATYGLAALIAPGVDNSGRIDAPQGMALWPPAPFMRSMVTRTPPCRLPPRCQPPRNRSDRTAARSPHRLATAATSAPRRARSSLAAEAKPCMVDQAINMDGVIQARSIQGRDGQIALVAGDNAGAVQVAGTLDASGAEAETTGGTVHVLGDTVALNAGADVNVSGPAGGGETLIGGAYLGGANTGSALQYVEVDSVTQIIADAGLEVGNYVPTSDITYFADGATVDARRDRRWRWRQRHRVGG